MASKEIIITIPKKKRQASAPRKGPIPPGRRSEYLARRRKKTGGINIYDPGYLKAESGLFSTVNFQILPTFDQLNPLSPPELFPVNFAARDSKLFEKPVSSWKSWYKKIAKGETSSAYGLQYNSEFVDGLEEWTEQGLMLTDDQLAAGITINHQLDATMFSWPNPDLKVTASYDFNAAPVAFSLSKDMNIYLIPEMMFSSGISTSKTSATIGVSAYLNYLYRISPREVDLEPSYLYYGFPLYGSQMPPVIGFDYANAYRATQLHKSFPNSRVFTCITDLESEIETWSSGGTFPNGVFPPPPTLPEPGPPFPDGGGLVILNSVFFGREVPGVLVSIVEKAGQFYYFWKS